jgi:hypothetical protein
MLKCDTFPITREERYAREGGPVDRHPWLVGGVEIPFDLVEIHIDL